MLDESANLLDLAVRIARLLRVARFLGLFCVLGLALVTVQFQPLFGFSYTYSGEWFAAYGLGFHWFLPSWTSAIFPLSILTGVGSLGPWVAVLGPVTYYAVPLSMLIGCSFAVRRPVIAQMKEAGLGERALTLALVAAFLAPTALVVLALTYLPQVVPLIEPGERLTWTALALTGGVETLAVKSAFDRWSLFWLIVFHLTYTSIKLGVTSLMWTNNFGADFILLTLAGTALLAGAAHFRSRRGLR